MLESLLKRCHRSMPTVFLSSLLSVYPPAQTYSQEPKREVYWSLDFLTLDLIIGSGELEAKNFPDYVRDVSRSDFRNPEIKDIPLGGPTKVDGTLILGNRTGIGLRYGSFDLRTGVFINPLIVKRVEESEEKDLTYPSDLKDNDYYGPVFGIRFEDSGVSPGFFVRISQILDEDIHSDEIASAWFQYSLTEYDLVIYNGILDQRNENGIPELEREDQQRFKLADIYSHSLRLGSEFGDRTLGPHIGMYLGLSFITPVNSTNLADEITLNYFPSVELGFVFSGEFRQPLIKF